MSIAEKAFLGSLMKAEYLLKDTVIQPEQLESTRHKEVMRRKTDVLLHFAKMADWAGVLPFVFSLEMPERLITTRLIASTGGFNRAKLRNPKRMLNQNQKNKWLMCLVIALRPICKFLMGRDKRLPK